MAEGWTGAEADGGADAAAGGRFDGGIGLLSTDGLLVLQAPSTSSAAAAIQRRGTSCDVRMRIGTSGEQASCGRPRPTTDTGCLRDCNASEMAPRVGPGGRSAGWRTPRRRLRT